jgi:BASS family bile acid:Na+ symporter
VGLILFSLAPTAPMLPILIRRARADISFAAAIMPLAVVSTVILMPLLAPLLIPGLTLSSWDIGRPLVISMLLPLVTGVLIRAYAAPVADKIFPAVKKIAGVSTVLLLGFVVLVNWRALLSTLGSFAVAALVLFTLGLALVAYLFGFGLNQAQRSAMALGVCSRNGSAMLMAVTAFPVIDPNLMAMSLLTVPLPLVVWLALASFFASRADGTSKESVA